MLKKVTLILLLMFLTSSFVFAHSGATGIVKDRMDAMKTISSDMKRLKTLLYTEDSYSAPEVISLSNHLADNGAHQMIAWFPEGSTQHPSEAKDTIWQEMDKFKALAFQFAELSSQLSLLAETTGVQGISEQKAIFMKIGQTCLSCHTAFREQNQ